MKTHARVVVIGGGVMGVSLLYHLAKRGWSDVVLVEKSELTSGSTWHAAGLCTHFAHNPTIMEMRAASVRLYRDILPDETGLPTGFHPCGALRVTRSPDRMDEFRHVQGLGHFTGYDFNVLTPGEVQEIFPLCQIDGLIGAIHEPDDGHVDPTLATNAMAAGARSHGAEIYRHTPAEAISRTGSGEWIIRTAKGDIRAEHVVNAAGTWCREIGSLMGIELPVVPILHQYLVTDTVSEIAERIATGASELPIIRDPEESWYLRQERDGFILGPYEKQAAPWGVDGIPPEFGMDLMPADLERVEHIVCQAMDRVPAVANAGVKTVVNGPITFTPDANPLIGPAFSLPNAWLLTGSSMGVMEGGGAGSFLADWIIDGAPPMDAQAVDGRRFGGYADRNYRLDKAVECFGLQFGVHYPFEERLAGRPRRVTSAHGRLAAAGAVFGCVNGWERPNWFSQANRQAEKRLTFRRPGWTDAVAAECVAVRDAVGLADLSAFSKFEVSEPDAAGFLDGLGANRAPESAGRIRLIHTLTPAGGVASEFTVTRLSRDRFYLTSAAAAERHDEDLLRMRSASHSEVDIVNRTGQLGIFAVMGPNSRSLLAALTDADLSDAGFPWLSAKRIVVAGIPVRALRVSYVGELGWELHVEMSDIAALYDALTEAGEAYGLRPFGAFAMNSMRLEKGYRAWGADLTTERTPVEAGLGALVRPGGRNFVGREALKERMDSPDAWRMELIELDSVGEVEPFYTHTLFRGDEPVGIITSAAFGHRTGKRLALAYLRPGATDSNFHAQVLGTRIPARVLDKPPYDPENALLRGERR